MEMPHVTRTRAFCFAVPALMDGALQLAQVALPLLAIRFGASALFLGMMRSTAQAVRLPFCFGSGMLSDRVGRTRVIIPAVSLAFLACLGFAAARNNAQLLVLYVLLMVSIGAFYPALQAFIGDHSPKGELRKNLSWFNVGWTIGGSVCALVSGYLLAAKQVLPFTISAFMVLIVIQVLIRWAQLPVVGSGAPNDAGVRADDGPGPLLLISRIGHFLGFFGFSMTMSLFPKLGVELGMSEGTIGVVVGMALVGQAIGIFLSSAGPWWRGKLWPQLLAQGMAAASGVIVYFAVSRLLFSAAFLLQGISLGIAYTGALYYGLQARTNMGRNTGIHESLVAGGNISGAFLGGLAAQLISLRAPYVLFAGLAVLAIAASLTCGRVMRET